MTTAQQLVETKQRLEELRKQAVTERIEELRTRLKEAKRLARAARDEFAKLRQKFKKYEGQHEQYVVACAKIEYQLEELANMRANEQFPSEAEVAEWAKLEAQLSRKLETARQLRDRARDAREAARTEAVSADQRYVHFAQAAQTLENEIDRLKTGGYPGGVFRV